jgi:hypothetical protein
MKLAESAAALNIIVITVVVVVVITIVVASLVTLLVVAAAVRMKKAKRRVHGEYRDEDMQYNNVYNIPQATKKPHNIHTQANPAYGSRDDISNLATPSRLQGIELRHNEARIPTSFPGGTVDPDYSRASVAENEYY